MQVDFDKLDGQLGVIEDELLAFRTNNALEELKQLRNDLHLKSLNEKSNDDKNRSQKRTPATN